ncbi:MAG: MFS transporter [Gemmatimonadales bacterium]|nr:MFS transporter [Gemmatimonadales bacterium]
MSLGSRLSATWQLAVAAWHSRLGSKRAVVEAAHFETAEADKIPFAHKLAYGMGAFVNNTLAAAIGGMTVILNLGLGMNPALVGLLGAVPRIFDALTDPLMGYISDNTRSRWGRRRPYIFIGAVTVGIIFAIMWQFPSGKSENYYAWYFFIGSLFFYTAYTIYATPWVALGYELTPDYHERTRLMGVQNFIGQMAYVISPWFLWIMTNESWFENSVEGAGGLAIAIGVVAVVAGVIPAIVLRERAQAAVSAETVAMEAGESTMAMLSRNMRLFGKGLATTLRSSPFRKLCVATFLVFNGFIMISSFQTYVIIYYVFGGDQQLGAKYAGYAGTLGAVSTFAIIFLVTMVGTKIGKRRAFMVSTGLSIVGYLLKWFCYDPAHPWLLLVPVPFMAFGLGGLFTLMGSMIADVVDMDELETHERREGMFGSIYWWVVKLGMGAALAAGGFLLNATGFDVALAGAQAPRTIVLLRLFDAVIPAIASAVAIYLVASYPISEAKAHEVRAELERRRGRLGDPVTP